MWKVISLYWKDLLGSGIAFTLLLALIAVIGGVIIGTLFAVGRMSKLKVLRGLIVAIVEVVRGTPALLQLYVGYFFVPAFFPAMNSLDPTLMAFICVAVALTINSGAYVSEIIRSGIEAVDKGQTEAARSLGLSGKDAMLDIVLPQAVKNILPALGNEFITIIKETSLASTFFVGELMTKYKNIVGVTYDSVSTLMVVGIIYFILDFALSKGMKTLERSMKAHA
ncbi:MAG: amino acid ABC transporter permease [Clostridia bacterium]|nr:amino acid ABC transporter permease [Clostridia bacterium]